MENWDLDKWVDHEDRVHDQISSIRNGLQCTTTSLTPSEDATVRNCLLGSESQPNMDSVRALILNFSVPRIVSKEFLWCCAASGMLLRQSEWTKL